MFMVDGLEEVGGTEGAREPASLGRRQEGSLVKIHAGIGLRCPLTRTTNSGINVTRRATGAILTGTPGEEWTGVEQPEVHTQTAGEDSRVDDVTKVVEEREKKRVVYGAGA
jgi:hypothetical protein